MDREDRSRRPAPNRTLTERRRERALSLLPTDLRQHVEHGLITMEEAINLKRGRLPGGETPQS